MVGSPGAVGERLAQVTARPIFVNLTAQGYVRFTAGRTHLVGQERVLAEGWSGESQSLSLARLLKRVFELDLEHCPNCGGELKVTTAILEQPVIEKILTHLGLRARASPRSPARGQGAAGGLSKVNSSPLERPDVLGRTNRLRPGFSAPRASGPTVRVDPYTTSLMGHRGRVHRLAANRCRH